MSEDIPAKKSSKISTISKKKVKWSSIQSLLKLLFDKKYDILSQYNILKIYLVWGLNNNITYIII